MPLCHYALYAMLHLQSAAMMFIAPGMPFGQVEAVAAVLVATFGKVSVNCSRESQWWLASWMDMPAVKSSLGSRFIDSIENQEWRIKIQISNPSVAWCVLQWSDSKNDSKHFVQWVQCSPGVGCSKQLTLHRKSILEQLYDLWSWAGRQWKILNCSKWFSEMTVLGRLMFSQIFASMCTASMK